MTYTAPTLSDGTPYPASMWQEALGELATLSAAQNAAWTAYGADATILTAATTNPTKGNSTWTALYRFVAPKQVQVRIRYVIGSTFTAGSGVYSWLLPFVATTNSVNMDLGTALINDQGTAYRNLLAFVSDTTHLQIVRNDQGAPIDNTGPGTAWANTDIVRINATYEIA